MLVWSLVLFGLGIMAVLDSQFNYGYLFRSANSFLFMLISLGLLIRTRVLVRLGFKEHLMNTNRVLNEQIEEIKRTQTPATVRETGQEVPA